jgi:hypothetical protein
MKTLRICLALFLTAICPKAAQMEMLPGDLVGVQTGAQYQRAAVDVSSNLKNWLQLTNVAAAAGQITFLNDPQQSDPMRFFRIADADETFAISGYIDGGEHFGGVASAVITESHTGSSVSSDANGFFHFNQRFARSSLPIKLTANAPGRGVVQREIRPGYANTFSTLSMPLNGPGLLDSVSDQTYHFKVTGGSRAGLGYSIRFRVGRVSVFGGIVGDGEFSEVKTDLPRYVMTFEEMTAINSEMFFWPVYSDANAGFGYFSGIPSRAGTLSGNGTVTWTNAIVAPPFLDGRGYAIGGHRIYITNGLYSSSIDGDGMADASRENNTWTIKLGPIGDVGFINTLRLHFATSTNGSYELNMPGQPPMSGFMHEIPFRWPTDGSPTPPTMSKITFNAEQSGLGNAIYTVNLNGGTSGTFAATMSTGDFAGAGTFTYSPGGTSAHLRLSYGGEIAGDVDDVTLEFKQSPVFNRFTGFQIVSGGSYPFSGTFTYESP